MIWAAVLASMAGVYYVLALIAALRHLLARDPRAPFSPPVSILKPLHGRDPGLYEALRSHALQDYPEFEILCGVRDPGDPAVEDIRRLAAEFPARGIRLVQVTRSTRNGKAGALADLAEQARFSVLIVNDSDITVPSGYLRSVVAPLADPHVGVVTCLYRAAAESPAARWEALGIETEFAPSVLVARFLGMAGFALGATMVLRAEQIRQIGGFAAVADYLADDYQLGLRISQLGYRVALARTAVETNLAGATWKQSWRHQLRWARTIRVSRPAGYYGYALTQATLWSLLAIGAGAWRVGIAVLAIRVLAGLLTGAGILGDRRLARDFYLIPVRDLWGFVNWCCGLAGDEVEWRGAKLKLLKNGKIA